MEESQDLGMVPRQLWAAQRKGRHHQGSTLTIVDSKEEQALYLVHWVAILNSKRCWILSISKTLTRKNYYFAWCKLRLICHVIWTEQPFCDITSWFLWDIFFTGRFLCDILSLPCTKWTYVACLFFFIYQFVICCQIPPKCICQDTQHIFRSSTMWLRGDPGKDGAQNHLWL